ncbi:hypothetical protein LTR56_018447 [Elasticomyces elasticus]|nr:hypothetical protein LTR56_018447 [Elasticomyces elasticus]KAK4908391.1 hypothetical protein LTR49_022704 [Elasticomyces elasticus]KAK5751719.1 hypothetical protein LTS12_018194 [Elasticomyces elasticus]
MRMHRAIYAAMFASSLNSSATESVAASMIVGALSSRTRRNPLMNSVTTNTSTARYSSPLFHSTQSIPAALAFETRLPSSARHGTTTNMTPGSRRQAGAMNSKLFPPLLRENDNERSEIVL